MDKQHENIKAIHRQLDADVAAGDRKAKAFANMLRGELNAARQSLGVDPLPPELPKSRVGERVTFTAPKSVGGPSVEGTIEDQVWTGPHFEPSWGWYAFFSEFIRWDDRSTSVRLSYYYWPLTKKDWIFGGQHSIEGTPSQIRELLRKTLEQNRWFE